MFWLIYISGSIFALVNVEFNTKALFNHFNELALNRNIRYEFNKVHFHKLWYILIHMHIKEITELFQSNITPQ